jgi:hypothetical protein
MYQEVHIWQSQNAGTVIEGLQSDVDNNLSFISASKRLFENYVDYIGSDVSWPDLEKDLLLTMGRSRRGDQHYGREERLERYSQMAKWLPLYTEYDFIGLNSRKQLKSIRR